VMIDPYAPAHDSAGQDQGVDRRGVSLIAGGPTNGPERFQRHENSTRGSNRRVIMTTCRAHGAAGFTNLLVTKEGIHSAPGLTWADALPSAC
ncbi:MAG: hypothetical protein WBL53_04540, partial [Pseudonocardiaceae bacterium]